MLIKGDQAPDFTATDERGKTVNLSDFKGKGLILYFYPKDMTPGCTIQAHNLTEHLEELKSLGYEVIGVSADSEKRHCRFIEKEKIGFHLIADVDKILMESYGVWGPKKFMGRTFDGIRRMTFIIGPDGLIEGIIDKVKTRAHAQQILEIIG